MKTVDSGAPVSLVDTMSYMSQAPPAIDWLVLMEMPPMGSVAGGVIGTFVQSMFVAAAVKGLSGRPPAGSSAMP